MKKCTFVTTLVLLLATAIFAQKTETRTFSNFNKINLAGGFDKVVLKEGTTESVTITATKIDLDKIETKQSGSSLHIGMKKGSYNNNGNVVLEITYRTIKEINSAGSSDVIFESPVKSDEFVFNLSGSGDLKGKFEVKEFKMNISGSGSADIEGTANNQYYVISGSGDIDASDMKGESAKVVISGSGDVDLNIDGDIKSTVSGSGDVRNKRVK